MLCRISVFTTTMLTPGISLGKKRDDNVRTLSHGQSYTRARET